MYSRILVLRPIIGKDAILVNKPIIIIAADIDESHHKKELPKLYAGRVAMQKAEKLVHLHPGKNILTADTVACCFFLLLLPKHCKI